MTGITPQGTISFVSEASGGQVSDKYLTENCSFLNNLLPGDLVIAERGFTIKEGIKTIRPRQAPWVTQTVKNFLRKKNPAYKSFERSGQPDDKLEGIQKMITEGPKLIEDATRNYFLKAGNTLANPRTSNRTYWYLINTVLNKVKMPIIPPLLENGLFVTYLTEKAQLCNDYFILQCTTIDTGSEIPQHIPVAASLMNDFVI